MIENAYILDFKLLDEQGISINEFIGLIYLFENQAVSIDILSKLQEKQFIKLNENEITIREKGNLLIELLLIENINKSNNKKQLNKSERLVNSEISLFIETFRNKWKGLKPGSMGSLSNCEDKMKRWMLNNPKYSSQEILNAADIYLKTLDNYTYLQAADYFIYKKDASEESSRLSAFVDEVLNNVDDNWTVNLK